MDVPVEEPGGEVEPRRVDDPRSLADAMRGAGAHVGDAPARHRHVDALLDFVRAHVDEPGPADHRVGRAHALRDGPELPGALP